MRKESVSEYTCLKEVQSRESRTLILKMWPRNAIPELSHPPARFYERGECVRVYVFKSSLVQMVQYPNFEQLTLQRDTIFLANEKGNLWTHAVGQRRQELNFACNPRSFQKLSVVPQRDHSWGIFYNQLSEEQSLQTLAIPCYALQILRIPWALVRCPALCSFLVFK